MPKDSDPCVVYWKHTPEMTDWSQGYIGISSRYEQRMAEHDRDAYLMNSPLEVHHQMRLNEGNVITDIIFESSRELCLAKEKALRPRWHMAWNMAAGGMFSNDWKANGKWLSNKVWHPIHGEVCLSKDFTLTDLSKKHGFAPSNISQILLGKLYKAKGWELQDKQLSQRVLDRLNKPLSEIGHIFLTKDGQTCKLYCNGPSQAMEYLGQKTNKNFGHLFRGLRESMGGWFLCTEEEYLANPGPVFGTEE